MSVEFSVRTRAANLDAMASSPVDILVIGGGIVGAWTALAATLRGYRSALVEKGDFASGTSGKTSRLIHGGLRYLQRFRIRLVRQAARERDLLLKTAPRLVKPLTFLIPVYRGRGPRGWQLKVGLFLYDTLSREKVLPRRRWVSRDEALHLEPQLSSEGLVNAALYADAVTHDARLVLRVVQAAGDAGALVANYATVTGLLREGGTVRGAKVLDEETRTEREVRAKAVVNATGVWSADLQPSEKRLRLRPTKGIHVFVPRDRIGHQHAVVLTAKDGRVVFVLPWGSLTLIGTTDTDYRGDRDRVEADPEDVEYLLSTVNAAFPRAALRHEDVVGTYAGLRPLLDRGEAEESDISRKHEIVVTLDGLITVAGGKLTTARAIAEEVLSMVEGQGLLRAPATVVDTRSFPLAPMPQKSAIDWTRVLVADPDVLTRLADIAALEMAREWGTKRPELLHRMMPGTNVSGLEVVYSAQREMVVHLDDLMTRRTGLAYEMRDGGLHIAPAIAELVGEELGWDAERRALEIAQYRNAVMAAHRWREATAHD